MALDRQSIEKKDFPIAVQGYDRAAVDAHLAALADEIEELNRSLRRPAQSLAVSSSEQVRAIVEAAETSASEIRHQAEAEARQIREQASTDARMSRDQATSQAREHLDKISASTATMLQRLRAVEAEMSALLESVRATAAEGPAVAAAAPEPTLREAAPEPVLREVAPEPVVREVAPAPAVSKVVPDPGVEGAREEADGRSEDAESARLIALNMALSNTPREEIDRYLAERYRLIDRGKLLDEVYESVHS